MTLKLVTNCVSKKYFWIVSLLLLSLLWPLSPAAAQDAPPTGPVYIVQSGDTLWDIAARFGVTMDELKEANGITDVNQVYAGAQLIIPGLEGVQGVLTTQEIPLGETLSSLARSIGVSADVLVRLNHITSPSELYAGASLIIPQSEETPTTQRTALATGQSLLELAALHNTNPWALSAQNQLEGTWAALPGEVLRAPGAADSGPGALPSQVTSFTITPLTQGQTAVVRLEAPPGTTLSGSLMDYTLHFFPLAEGGGYVALQGVHAMAEPGLYTLRLSGMLPGGIPLAFSQSIRVQAGQFIYEKLTVDPKTRDPTVTGPENEQWMALAAPATPTKMWEGMFAPAVDPVFLDCITSWYGNRRSYNDSGYIYFHTGLDYCNGSGSNVYAPAPGTVVFAGFLEVRGNATMIDHGWGVYTAYMHQSELLVQEGDVVETGQVIGITGGTGRVQGPHLHWEILVGGVQVDPEAWLAQAFP